METELSLEEAELAMKNLREIISSRVSYEKMVNHPKLKGVAERLRPGVEIIDEIYIPLAADGAKLLIGDPEFIEDALEVLKDTPWAPPLEEAAWMAATFSAHQVNMGRKG